MKNQASLHQPCRTARYRTFHGAIAVVLLTSLNAMAISTNFTTAGNFAWTVPANVTSIQVECWGGGGAGGGCAASPNYTCAGGGAGGAYVRCTLGVTPNASYYLTVGMQGSAGQGVNGRPSYFGNTSVGITNDALVLAVGGQGGTSNLTFTAGTANNRTGAIPGGIGSNIGNIPSTGSGSFLSFAGTSGSASVGGATNGYAHSGAGGAAASSAGTSGGGAGGVATNAPVSGSATGVVGTAPGGGGSGGANTTSTAVGGAGGVGRVIITYLALASVTTTAPTNISTISANLTGTITTDNATSLTDRGFYWKTSSGVTATDNQLSEGGTDVSSFSATLGGLAANTTYYVRAYAVNAIGLSLGPELSFITAPNDPTAPIVGNPSWGSLDVTLGTGGGNLATAVYAIQETTTGNYVQADGTLGGAAVYQTAAIWNPAGAPVTVSGLASSTTYTFQVKAHNSTSNDSGYSPAVSGTTTAPVAPLVISQTATGTTTTGARLNGKIIGDGNATITERGFYWKTSPGVTTADTQVMEGGMAVGSFFSDLGALSVNAPYYYRAYAVNSVGMNLGAEIAFWTLANTPLRPVVNNPTTNSLDLTLAAGDGNPVGTVYAIEEMYTETFVQAGGSLAASPVYQTIAAWNPSGAALTVTGLNASSTYTFKVKAHNGAGVDTSLSAPASATCSTPNSSTPNAAPSVTVISAVQRPGTTFMDIDFRVDDPDDAIVQVAALGFVNGGTSLSDIVKVSTLTEGTSANLGTNVPANTNLHLTWNVAADWNTNFGNVQVEILAKDNRGLLPFHWITLPANGTNSHLTISDRSYLDSDFLPVWYWLIANGDPSLTLLNGVIYGATNPYAGFALASGTSTTVTGRYFLGSKIGFRPVTDSEINRASAGPYGNQTFFQNIDANSIAKGYSLTSFNVVYGWGSDSYGQLDFVPQINSMDLRSVALGANFTLALNGTSVAGWGFNGDGEIAIPPSATNVIAISAGAFHTLALRSDHSVVAWGLNIYGETNVPPNATNVVAVCGGRLFSLAVRSDGSVVGWGYNGNGQLTIPASATNITAVSAGTNHCIALRSNGTVVAWGNNTYGQTNVPVSATNIVAIAAGGAHNLALRADGTLITWGLTSTNNLANIPTMPAPPVAITAGAAHSLVLCNDGSVVVWGSNLYGQTNKPVTLSAMKGIGTGSFANHAVAFTVLNQ